MKNLYKKIFVVLCLCLAQLVFGGNVLKAQNQSARSVTLSSTTNCGGFYEYLPDDYNSTSTTYPLLVFIHGVGELGNGTTDLPSVLRNGPPKLISQGVFPSSFTVNNRVFKFIVISPQFVKWPSSTDVRAIITYAIDHYRVDISRIYLTGLSMGGGATWQFAGGALVNTKLLAAILPVSGASPPTDAKCANMAIDNLPVWATHNLNDPTVKSSYTTTYVNTINSNPNTPNPRAVATIFNAGGHDAWTQTYDPNWRPNGLNVFEWMLQFQNTKMLPVELADYTAYKNDKSSIKIDWSTSFENNNRYFILERSFNGANFSVLDTIKAINTSNGGSYSYTDTKPFELDNFYRLKQVDLDGKTTTFKVLSVKGSGLLKEALTISPNPVQSTINLQWVHNQKGNLNIVLLDLQGKQVAAWKYQKQDTRWNQSISLPAIATGTYILQIKGDQSVATQKIFKN